MKDPVLNKGVMERLHAAPALLALSAAAFSPAYAQDFDKIEIKTEKVADGVYMLVGYGGNIGLSTGKDGAFVIDDQFAPLSDKIMAAIDAVSDNKPVFVLNTHFHFDHTGGNEAFGESGSHIVAHDNVRTRLKEGLVRGDGSVTEPSPEIALPVITFSKTMTFHWNGREIFVWHPTAAHTDGDAIVFFKDVNVVHMGDVFFNGNYPYIDLEAGGDLDGYITTHEAMLGKIDDKTKIIPGHGPLASKKDLEKTLAMLKDVRQRIKVLVEAGLSIDQAVAADPLKDLNDDWGNGYVNGERMVRQIYTALTAE